MYKSWNNLPALDVLYKKCWTKSFKEKKNEKKKRFATKNTGKVVANYVNILKCIFKFLWFKRFIYLFICKAES